MADVNINKFRASVVRDGSKPSSPGFIVSEGQDPVNPPGTNNYVPYSGATANVELGEYGVEAGFITLDTTPTNTPTDQGTIFWDADDETVDIVLNGYTMKIGEDLFYPVKNQTGSTIAKGVAVRFNGTVGNSGRLLIAPFIADGSVPSSRFMGVTAEEILNGENGKVLYFGRVRGINTNAFNEGDILYASTTVAGGYQTAIPVAPNNIVQVAAVVTKSATVGTIFVRPTIGSNINKDEGVKITSVADKNLLQYQSGTSLWENKSLAQVLGGTSAQFVKGDGSLDSNTYGTGTVTSVGLSSATSGVTIGSTPVTTSGTITLAIATASGSQNGLLSSTDWTTFNGKQNALTNPVTGTGTTNYVSKFTGASTVGNSQIFDNGTNVGVNTTTFINVDTGWTNFTVNGSTVGLVGVKSNGNNIGAMYGNNANNDFTIQAYGSSNNARMNFLTASSLRLSILGNGNVTVGTSNATTLRFTVAQIFSSHSMPALGSLGGLFGFFNTDTEGGDLKYGLVGEVSGATGNVSLQAQRVDGTATAYNMILQQNGGNLLVGTTTDNGARLQVSGTGKVFTWSGATTGTQYFDAANTGANLVWGMEGSAGGILYSGASPYSAVFGNENNYPVQFGTNATIRMTITSVGYTKARANGGTYFGGAYNEVINNNNASGAICLVIGNAAGSNTNNTASYHLIVADNAGDRMYVYGNGNVVNVNNAYGTLSDIALKENIKDATPKLEDILKLKVRNFNLIGSDEKQIGFIAQELEQIFPKMVDINGINQMKTIKTSVLIPMLVKAIQELKQQIDTLKN